MAEFIAKKIDDSEIPKWDELALKSGSIFQSSTWADLFAAKTEKIGIYDGYKLTGGFLLSLEKKLGLKIIHNPPFTPYVGPFGENRGLGQSAEATDYRRKLAKAMLSYIAALKPHIVTLYLAPGWVDGLPFFWQGYKVVYSYTYIIDLTAEETALRAGLSKSRRSGISKALKDGIAIRQLTDINEVIRLVRATYERKKEALPVKNMEHIVGTMALGQQSYALGAYEQDKLTAVNYIVNDDRGAYNLLSGSLEEANLGACGLLLFESLLEAKRRGKIFLDLEGSSLTGVEHFYRSFGGTLTPVMTINKAILPLEMALKLRLRSRF